MRNFRGLWLVKGALLLAICLLSPLYALSTNPISITTQDRKILKNGQEFVTKGVVFEGFIEPADWLAECVQAKVPRWEYCERHLDSRDYYYGRNKYANKDALGLAVNEWNINSVRFNLNQVALDPESLFYSREYLTEVKGLVNTARDKGLVVFITLFSATNLNAPDMLLARNPKQPLNTKTSLNAAINLAKNFGQDGGVIIELLNEPWSPTKVKTGWQLWRNGGTLDNPRSPFNKTRFVGIQQIVNAVRNEGAINAIVIQTLGLGGNFNTYPGDVIDPLNRIIYAVHPFFNTALQNEKEWDKRFGNFAATRPFIVTAWEADADDPWCQVSGIGTPQKFLTYLSQKNIGLIGYSFDTPYSITKNFQTDYDTPTNLGSECTKWGRVGSLIQRHFKAS